ncbi:hypothetical protein EW146_g7903 [Bondarzewia mesenterica]|uniref:Peptidase S54 rhomboid domain-containing protein n=1 Tax=Bondarzewia mesenterica TaxID=1095465 RepID=A0A4S4LIL5_9AGAM|nr:hypothetical protein EW146_g7903 [Bondarzewia mesenterica]
MWRTPAKRVLSHAFLYNPLINRHYPMMTSLVSHRSFPHLLVSCISLPIFGSATSKWMNREQEKRSVYESTDFYHMLAFLVTAAAFSNAVSYVAFFRLGYNQITARFSSVQKPSRRLLPGSQFSFPVNWLRDRTSRFFRSPLARRIEDMPPPVSLGACGPIYAMATISALAYPDIQSSISWFPVSTTSLRCGLGGALLVDAFGIFYACTRFNHWAHIGGALFGALYYARGMNLWNLFRELGIQHAPSEDRKAIKDVRKLVRAGKRLDLEFKREVDLRVDREP